MVLLAVIVVTAAVFSLPAAAGTTELASVSTGDTQANEHVRTPVISANGRYVVFESAASTLVPGDTNGVNDVFVRDLLLGQTYRVSVAYNGEQGNDGCVPGIV